MRLAMLLPLAMAAVSFAAPQVAVVIEGSKTGVDNALNTPFGIAFDDAGNGYIVELDGGRIHKLDAAGKLTTLGGVPGELATRGRPAPVATAYTGDGGPIAKATFNGMHSLAVNAAGDLYIADTWNNVIRKVDHKTGVITTFAGTGERGFASDGGPAAAAKLSSAICVALAPAADRLIVTDLGNRRIRAIDLKSGVIETLAGTGKAGTPADGSIAKDSPLADPRAAVLDSKGNLYILERGGNALRCVSPDGKIRTVAGGSGKAGKADGDAARSSLNGPKHLCVDREDNVIIADAENNLIRKYDAKTGILSTLPIPGLARPHGVTVDRDGSLWVVDSYNHRVLKVTGY